MKITSNFSVWFYLHGNLIQHCPPALIWNFGGVGSIGKLQVKDIRYASRCRVQPRRAPTQLSVAVIGLTVSLPARFRPGFIYTLLQNLLIFTTYAFRCCITLFGTDFSITKLTITTILYARINPTDLMLFIRYFIL